MVVDNSKTNNSTTSGFEVVKDGVPQGSILGPQLFLQYGNDLPKIPTNRAKIILYVDDSSVKASNPSSQDFNTNVNKVFVYINELCKTNLMSLYLK